MSGFQTHSYHRAEPESSVPTFEQRDSDEASKAMLAIRVVYQEKA